MDMTDAYTCPKCHGLIYDCKCTDENIVEFITRRMERGFKIKPSKLKKKISNLMESDLSAEEKTQLIFDAMNAYTDHLKNREVDLTAKLDRKFSHSVKSISSGLKAAINDHGPITLALIHSAAKRIHGMQVREGSHGQS